MIELLAIGSLATAERNICNSLRSVPYIMAGEEVTILGYLEIEGKHGRVPGYRVATADGMQIAARASDITARPTPKPLTLEQIARDAFLAGYSEGHSRGLTCGRLYGADDQYGQIIQVAKRDYIRRLRGEDESDC